MQQVAAFAGVAEARGPKHEDVFTLGDIEDLAALGIFDRLINIRVDAVGNMVNRETTQHTGTGLVGEPLAGSDDAEVRAAVDPVFKFPFDRRGVAGDGGIGSEVWALAAAGLPFVAGVTVGAVAGEAPHVVEGEESGFGGGEVVDRKIIKIPTVKVMEVEDISFRIEGVLGNIWGGLMADVIEAQATGNPIDVFFEVARSRDFGH